MANEFERINNPDSTPGAISTGYQLQNTNLISQRVGLDCSVVLGGTGQCTLEVSGPVDVNGEIYTCNAQATFTLTTAGKYYIHLAGSGANLTPTIGTDANTFDADKNARYTDTGTYRVLNWVIYYDGTTAFVHRLVNPVVDANDYGDVGSPEEYYIVSNGDWIAKRTKYYTIYVTGSGGDGGSVANGTTQVGAGGGAGATVIKRILVTAGTTWSATFSATENQFTTFTDGVTSITAENGANGNTGTATALGGAGGNTGTSYDVIISGGYGNAGVINTVALSGNGGSSFWGGGGRAMAAASGGSASGVAGSAYGSGGGGAATVAGLAGSAGAGKVGIIRIVG